MLSFILRRLALMIPTLLGISLVTLGLVRLAPGDPVQAQLDGVLAKGSLSPEEIEALRRTYFLHLPLLLNFDPDDAADVDARLMESLSSPDEKVRDRNVRRLASRGGIALPLALETAAGASPEARSAILAGLALMAPRLGVTGVPEGEQALAFWQGWFAPLKGEFTSDGARAAVDSLVRGEEGSDARVKRLDTFALAALFAALEEAPRAGEASQRIMTALSHANGLDIQLRPGDDEATVARAYSDWQRWWYTRRVDFSHFSGLSALSAVVVETQYFKWVRRLVTLDFDRSSRDNVPVRDKLRERLGKTLLLATLGLMFSYLVAVPLGIFSAVKQYTLADRAITVALFILYSLPSFWVAMLLQQFVCGVDPRGFEWFPLVGLTSEGFEALSFPAKVADLAWHLVLPVLCLSYASLASLSRYQRVGMLDTIRQDYVRTARAKGLSERVVVFKHALRNSVIPIITLLGLQLPFLVSGAVIVELIFQINGMGLETFEAIRTRDLNWIMATVTLTAVMTMGGILLSDILYALVDPRIQVGGKEG